jgi:hypothetical protein
VPIPSEEKTRTVEDFAELLAALEEEGFDYAVIGGCAVGAYGRLRGEEVLTMDLDLIASPTVVEEILDWAPKHGLTVNKRPQPRSIPTAFLTWHGKEINILSYSHGLPSPEDTIRAARIFELRSRGGTEVPIADCYHLLENKLNVNRPKDQPHIEILRRFIEEEVVAAFESEKDPRARLNPARNLLRITKSRFLPEPLAARLIPLARTAPDLRFLANAVPTEAQARTVLEKSKAKPELAEDVARILQRRVQERGSE